MKNYTIVDGRSIPLKNVFFYASSAFCLKVVFEPEVFPGGEFSGSFPTDYLVVADSIDDARTILETVFCYSKFQIESWYQLPNSTFVQHSIKNKENGKLF